MMLTHVDLIEKLLRYVTATLMACERGELITVIGIILQSATSSKSPARVDDKE